MGQHAPIKTNDGPDCVDALSWAHVAGLVHINPNGSWQLTPEGLSGMLKLLGQAHPYVARSVDEGPREVGEPADQDQPRVPYVIPAREYPDPRGRAIPVWAHGGLRRPDSGESLQVVPYQLLEPELL